MQKQKKAAKALKEESRFENETFLTVGKKKKPTKEEPAAGGRSKGKGKGNSASNAKPRPRTVNDDRGNDLTRIAGGRRNDGWN